MFLMVLRETFFALLLKYAIQIELPHNGSDSIGPERQVNVRDFTASHHIKQCMAQFAALPMCERQRQLAVTAAR